MFKCLFHLLNEWTTVGTEGGDGLETWSSAQRLFLAVGIEG